MRTPTLLAAVLLAGALAGSAQAKPPGPATFCQKYPGAPACVGGQPACTYCHTSPPTRNAYGAALEAQLAPGATRPLSDGDFATALPAALAAAEGADSDGDGVTNGTEISKGTFPGDGKSFPNDVPCAGGVNPSFKVCKYDARYVYRKLVLDFCGTSPTYEQLQDFVAITESQKPAELDAALDRCLKSEFWRAKNGQLWQLAHRKVRPVGSLKNGDEDKGQIPLADYYDDYALYAWSQIDGHDARDVLTAKYFVQRTVSGTPAVTRYSQVATLPIQFIDLAHRAGNLTSAWNLVYNVMFTALPRNAASQAYRGYLGLDIAKQEGLYPVAGEPKDYDAKGVQDALCSQCHATLDPLSYPFRNYNGLTNPFAQYDAQRIEKNFLSPAAPNIAQTPESGVIMGQKVNNLVEWATVAANSDAFASATVGDYWRLLMGAGPTAEQHGEYTQLWQGLKANNYDVEKMLHALIRTEAYGAP